jgi:Ser/Thr protein kinase RdoA (MazF antagonist)
MHAALNVWLTAVLEEHTTLIADRSWPDGRSLVYEVSTGTDTRWFVKQHNDPEWYRAELSAYHRWVPALADRGPVLYAHDDSLLVLVVSALRASGTQDWHDDKVRYDAGSVLRRLHDAESFGPFEDIASAKQAEVQKWSRRGEGLLTPTELDFALTCASALDALPKPARVPCHRDFTPRNWIIDSGRVQVIDFEEMASDAWLTDIGRMRFGFWRDEAHLIDAVLDGYGRCLSDDEIAVMALLFVVTAVRLIVLGSELGKHGPVERTHEVLHDLRTGRLSR